MDKREGIYIYIILLLVLSVLIIHAFIFEQAKDRIFDVETDLVLHEIEINRRLDSLECELNLIIEYLNAKR